MAKTGVPFNVNAPTGHVTPPENGAFFEQKGRDGKNRLYGPPPHYPRVLRPGEELEDVKSAPPPAKPKARKAAAKEEEAPKPERFGRAAGMGNKTTVEGYPVSTDDLVAWGKGEKEIPFAPTLQEAFEHHFETTPDDEVEAGEILVQQGLLTEEELSPIAG